jgi:hypothetical protein
MYRQISFFGLFKVNYEDLRDRAIDFFSFLEYNEKTELFQNTVFKPAPRGFWGEEYDMRTTITFLINWKEGVGEAECPFAFCDTRHIANHPKAKIMLVEMGQIETAFRWLADSRQDHSVVIIEAGIAFKFVLRVVKLALQYNVPAVICSNNEQSDASQLIDIIGLLRPQNNAVQLTESFDEAKCLAASLM